MLTKPQDETKTSMQEKKTEKPKETLPEFIAGLASVFIVGLFIITFVVQHFEIPSRSMEQTLLVGDHVFVDRLTPTGTTNALLGRLFPYRHLHRGDTAVFLAPAEPGLYLVKRIIAVPGDRLHLQGGVVYLNGIRQEEPYVIRDGSYDRYRDEFPSVSPFEVNTAPGWPVVLAQNIHDGDVVVPPDHYFAMGDNRNNSLDSRYWGFVPAQNVVGTPLFIAWSLNQTEADFPTEATIGERITAFLRTTVHFFGLTRWHRVMRLVH